MAAHVSQVRLPAAIMLIGLILVAVWLPCHYPPSPGATEFEFPPGGRGGETLRQPRTVVEGETQRTRNPPTPTPRPDPVVATVATRTPQHGASPPANRDPGENEDRRTIVKMQTPPAGGNAPPPRPCCREGVAGWCVHCWGADNNEAQAPIVPAPPAAAENIVTQATQLTATTMAPDLPAPGNTR